MAFVGILAALAFFLFICYLLMSARHRARPKTWPLLGVLPNVVLNAYQIHNFVHHLLRKNGYTSHLKVPMFPELSHLLTSDPDNVHHILAQNSSNYIRGQGFRNIFDVLGDGVIAADGESWKLQRRLLHSLFKQPEFLKMEEKKVRAKVESGVCKLLDRAARSGSEIDLQDVLHRFTFDIACWIALGCDASSLSFEARHSQLLKAMDDIEETTLRRYFKPRVFWKLQRWMQMGVEKRGWRINKLFEFIDQQISLRRREPPETEGGEAEVIVKHSNITSRILSEEDQTELAAKFSNKNQLDKFIKDLVFSILTAGSDTSSSALAWFFWLVETNPSVKSNIIQEMRQAEHESHHVDHVWKFPNSHKLNYLHAALCETLRLYPAAPFNHRSSVKPDTLPSGHRIDGGTPVVIPMYTMGRMQEIWGEDCREFKPERWINDGSVVHYPSNKFCSFGGGARICPGRDLAFMNMKIIAAAVVCNYDLHVVDGSRIKPASAMVLRMKHGLKVRVTKKNIICRTSNHSSDE
uniref:Cytochrome P450 n=1 Tax=Kalanchoe fedtschenkoi TaxID=63787 RepID=A0A7N0TP31_KALFE